MKKKTKTIIIILSIVGALICALFLLRMFHPSSRSREGSMALSLLTPNEELEKNSIDKEVAFLNYDLWNSTVSDSFLPDYYFGDYSILPGASGEFVIRSWSSDIWNASEIFTYFLIPRSEFVALSNSDFNETYIDKNYFGIYLLNHIYTSPAFEDDGKTQVFYIFNNPRSLKKLFDDYNSYVEDVNNDTNPFTPTLTAYTPEEFLFDFFVNQTAVATPANFYLSVLVNDFDDEDVRMGYNELILDLEGGSNYTVRIGFDEMGLSSYILYLDEYSIPFYVIITDYSHQRWIVWLIVGSISTAIIALLSYLILKQRKRNREFQESLERMEA